ncbi:MAG: hypothetical protein ACLUE8_16035 [Lachnospiraceae bacterium]
MPFALGFHTTFALPFVEGGKSEDVRLKLGVGEEIERNMDTFLPTGRVIEDSPMRQEMLQGSFQPTKQFISRHFAMDESREMRLMDLERGVQIIYRAFGTLRLLDDLQRRQQRLPLRGASDLGQ